DNVSATCVTEFARHRIFQIAARKGFWRTANVTEPFGWHQHKHVGCSAADVLTFAAEALRFEARFALSNVSDFPAIASAFERHLKSSACGETLIPKMKSLVQKGCTSAAPGRVQL